MIDHASVSRLMFARVQSYFERHCFCHDWRGMWLRAGQCLLTLKSLANIGIYSASESTQHCTLRYIKRKTAYEE
jgi:hypothetical protein